MELDQTLIAESMVELEALENETKLLLETIRGKSKTKKAGATQKSGTNAGVGKNKRTVEGEQSKTRTKKKKGSSGFQSGSGRVGRVTVEILDDASPDATPREDNEEHLQRIAKDKEKLKALQNSEQHFRKLQFDDERARVVLGADTFVPGPGLSVADVEIERARLARIEESARRTATAQQSEIKARKDYLENDRVALKLQSVFRGHLGRQKFSLTHKIKKMKDDDEYGDWIEVSDPATGDVWYYNQESGLSQWEKPAAMNRRKTSSAGFPGAGGMDGTEKLPKIKKDKKTPRAHQQLQDIEADTSSPKVGRNKQHLSVSMALPSIDALTMGKQAVRPSSSDGGGAAGALRPSSTGFSTGYTPTGTPGKLTKSLSFKGDLTSTGGFTDEDSAAKEEIIGILGVGKLAPPESLTAPDGTFKPQLRTVVLDALLDTRFDSVATVLADTRWFENDEEAFNSDKQRRRKRGGNEEEELKLKKKLGVGSMAPEDLHRQPLVAQLTFNKKKNRRGRPMEATDTIEKSKSSGALLNQHLGATGDSDGTAGGIDGSIKRPADLNFKEIEHTGFENAQAAMDNMCFGCWSAGLQRKCELHNEGAKVKPSQTMLLCRNWDLDVMRRRYRSEEIQELFMQREASLRYDVKHKKFSTVVEQRHPIYRFLLELNDTFKNRMVLFEKIKRWLLSMAEELRVGHLSNSYLEKAHLMRIKRNLVNHSKLARFTVVNLAMLPMAPTTGSSWPERIKQVQYLFSRYDQALSQEIDLIQVYPTPVPKYLYLPREYHLPLRKSIPMPKPSYTEQDPYARVQPSNTYIPDDHGGAWLEKMASSVARDCVQAAKSQVKAFTPLTQVGIVSRTMKPVPSTIKAATTGRKPTPGNMAVGGLALEMLVFQLVSTYLPTQYGSFMVTDKGSVSPGISPEVNISFTSISMAPIVQHHLIRPLEHPLNYRRAPTITLNANIHPDEQKHFYGLNRPEQTGEQEPHGFRTTSWAPMLLTYMETDPQTFVPGQEVVSLNMPKANVSFTTHADYTYPFCEPSTRDNSTLDFFHLLLAGVVSAAKAQVFTALTIQEPGQFMKNYDANLPMGHLLVNVYRSWAFTQRDTIQEFRTDDGVPYWYHRKTGQTFWERPLFEDEEDSPLHGGTILDTEHGEEPSEMSRGQEGSSRRYDQGEFRNIMMNHIETKKDAINRRKSAAGTISNARQRGLIPIPEGMESVLNNPQESVDIGSRFDFPKPNNSSLVGSLEPSGTLADGSRPATAAEVGASASADYVDLSHLHPNNLFNQQQTLPGSPGRSFAGSPGQLQGGMSTRPGTTSTFAGGAGQFGVSSRSYRPDTGASTGMAPGTANSGALFGTMDLNQTANSNTMMSGKVGSLPGTAAVPGSRFDQDGSFIPAGTQDLVPGSGIDALSVGNGSTRGGMGMGMGGNFGSQQQQQRDVPAFNGLDVNMISNLSNALNNMMNTMMLMDSANPQNMVTMGLGMGMALMQSGAVQNMVTQQVDAHNQPSLQMDSHSRGGSRGGMHSAAGFDESGAQQQHINMGGFPTIGEEESSQLSRESASREQLSNSQSQQPSRVSSAIATSMLDNKNEPIGKVHPTQIFSADKSLDRTEEMEQKRVVAERLAQPLDTMEIARNLKIDSSKPTQTPDDAPPKMLTDAKPSNAEDGLIENNTMPLLAYPELSTHLPNGAHIPYTQRPPAGHGTSFVHKEEEITQQMVPGSDNLRRTVMPLPVGFFEAIEAKHVAKQAADYLPQVPNMPQARHIGRVRPRSAALDWLMINFDPWSAGKNPLGVEFVSSLLDTADKFVQGGPAKAAESFDQMRNASLAGAFVTTNDETGLAKQRAEISKAQHLAEDFGRVCSLCRHSKFSDAEQLMNQPDWSVPIDYQDDQGNTLLHIVAQNGNKRMVKLCLRRGAALDVQNLTGQTPLHFAYGYGYADVGDYLLSRGANDSLRNKDGLTCYEGLGAKELELL